MNPAKSVSRRYSSPHGLLAADAGSAVARLTRDLEQAGWVVERTVDGANVTVRLSAWPRAAHAYRFTGPTAIDAIRLAASFAGLCDG